MMLSWSKWQKELMGGHVSLVGFYLKRTQIVQAMWSPSMCCLEGSPVLSVPFSVQIESLWETILIVIIRINKWNVADLDSQIASMIYRLPDGSWCCTECGYSSKISTNVKMHVENKHIVSAGFNCPFCHLSCPNRKCLRNHTARKHGKEGKW